MGTARFLMSEELIRDLLDLPPEALIREIHTFERTTTKPTKARTFQFEVYDPEIPDGIHDAKPIVFQEFRTWEWNIKEEKEDDH